MTAQMELGGEGQAEAVIVLLHGLDHSPDPLMPVLRALSELRRFMEAGGEAPPRLRVLAPYRGAPDRPAGVVREVTLESMVEAFYAPVTRAAGQVPIVTIGESLGAAAGATSLAVALTLLTCTAPRPMSSEGRCVRIPDVNDCIFVARWISDRCLSDCVAAQCAQAHVRCSEKIAAYCEQRADAGYRVGGFVPRLDQSCKEAADEVQWCDLNATNSCKAQMVVHELAHACGWHHGDGFNVPGNAGAVECR